MPFFVGSFPSHDETMVHCKNTMHVNRKKACEMWDQLSSSVHH